MNEIFTRPNNFVLPDTKWPLEWGRETGLDIFGNEVETLTGGRFPGICGGDEHAWRIAPAGIDRGVFVQNTPHPVVPKRQARRRCIATANFSEADVDTVAKAVVSTFRQIPPWDNRWQR